MNTAIFAAVMAGVIACSTTQASAATVINGVDVGDQYLNPHAPFKGSAASVPLFVYPPDPENEFNFNYHYASMPIKWSLELPSELAGKAWQVTSATITLWNGKGYGGWDPAAYDIQLFKTGITGDNGFTRDSWTENDYWYNPAGTVQDPFLVELGTGAHAENNPAAAPWGIAAVDPSYTGEASPAEAFPVTFTLDLTNTEIKTQLTTDINNGYSLYAIASTYPAAQSGGFYPRFVTKEGVSNTSLGTLQQAPALTIEVSEQASARDWNLY